MARQNIENQVPFGTNRERMNANFTELYEKIAELPVDGVLPLATDEEFEQGIAGKVPDAEQVQRELERLAGKINTAEVDGGTF